MNKELMVKAFNEWMRRYIENPKGFKVEFQSVMDYCREKENGKKPSYGTNCTMYLHKLGKELTP